MASKSLTVASAGNILLVLAGMEYRC